MDSQRVASGDVGDEVGMAHLTFMGSHDIQTATYFLDATDLFFTCLLAQASSYNLAIILF